MNNKLISKLAFALALSSIAAFTFGQDKNTDVLVAQPLPAVSVPVCRNSGSAAAGAPSTYFKTIDEANSAGWYLEEDGSGNCFKEALCQSNSMLQPDHKTCACPLEMPYWDGNACAIALPLPPQRLATVQKVRNCSIAFEFGPLIARCDATDPERLYVLSNVIVTLADGSSGRYGEGAKWQTVRRGDTATLTYPAGHTLLNAFVNIAKIDACNWHADGFAGSYVRHTELDGNVNFCQ